jgi:hypothetical protein
MFIIIEGLNKILKKKRKAALNSFIKITKKYLNFKVIINNREELDISYIFCLRVILLKIGLKNS